MKVHSSIPAPLPGIIFIPDISGFTRFVNETEISHSQHIIGELLEVIIQATDDAFEVSEIEGDAVLFFRLEENPVLADLENLVHTIFKNFHQHLKYYQRDLICHCGACSSVSNLSLKFIMHYGLLSTFAVNDRIKLSGRDIIVAHRFLKNKLTMKDYILISGELAQKSTTTPEELHDYVLTHEEFEGLGELSYYYRPLEDWFHTIQDPPPREHFKLPVPDHMVEVIIDATPKQVIHALIEPSQRLRWMSGVKRITLKNHKITRIKTEHECLIAGQQVMVTLDDFVQEGDKMSLMETGIIKTPPYKLTTFYSIEPVNAQKTKVGMGTKLTAQKSYAATLLLRLTKFLLKMSGASNLKNLKSFLEQRTSQKD